MRGPLLLVALASCSTPREAPPRVDDDSAPARAWSAPLPIENATIPRPSPVPGVMTVQYAAPPPARTPGAPRSKPGARGPGGAKRIGTGDYWFGTGPGYVYSCQGEVLRTWPKGGGDELSRGPCHGAFSYLGDDSGTYFCDSDGVKRIPEQGDPELLTAEAKGCILDAIDDRFAYYVVPGFVGVKNPGLYRIAKRGGEPTKLYASRKGEQIFIALDGDQLWMGAWGAGTISRMPKAGGTLTTVITGQRGIVNLQVDGQSLYWYPESTGEIRRRAKRGGPIEVVAKGLDQEPILVHDGHLFWFAGSAGKTQTLMQLAPNAAAPKVLVSGLMSPSLTIDDEGIFFQEFGKQGIYMLPLPE